MFIRHRRAPGEALVWPGGFMETEHAIKIMRALANGRPGHGRPLAGRQSLSFRRKREGAKLRFPHWFVVRRSLCGFTTLHWDSYPFLPRSLLSKAIACRFLMLLLTSCGGGGPIGRRRSCKSGDATWKIFDNRDRYLGLPESQCPSCADRSVAQSSAIVTTSLPHVSGIR
jgi:hypothetical protein